MAEVMMLRRAMRRLPKFSYSGSYEVINDGGGNWRIKLLTSGTLVFLSSSGVGRGIDLFLVGGGGKGVRYLNTISWVLKGGGGAGYTKTVSAIPVTAGTEYAVTVGDAGEDSSAFGQSAEKGADARAGYTNLESAGGGSYGWCYGGNGGSGGAATNGGTPSGGVDGADGEKKNLGHGSAGTGQGSTTREFGESTGALYATGGGADTPDTANSGNGGWDGAEGASGIVIIRNHRR